MKKITLKILYYAMKTKLFIRLTLIFLIGCYTSCSSNQEWKCDLDNKHYNYTLYLNIQDTSGTDLIKGIGCEYSDSSSIERFIELGYAVFNSDIFYTEEFDTIGGFAGILVKKDLYSLEVIYPEPCQDFALFHREPVLYHEGFRGYMEPFFTYEKKEPLLGAGKFNDQYYLFFDLKTSENYIDGYGNHIEEYENCPSAGKITLNLSCPYIFGDDAVHEIVTWWEPTDIGSNIFFRNQICTHIEFDGQVSSKIKYEYHYTQVSFATVTIFVPDLNYFSRSK